MKRFIVSLSILALILGFGGVASAAFFTFDDLNPGDGATAISSYMTGVNGGNVTVSAVGQPHAEGLGLLWNYLGDRYIESEPIGTLRHPAGHVIEITFSNSYNTASFDWGTLADRFYAEADGVVIFDSGSSALRTGHFDYASATPFHELTFHDSFLGEVAIDNLSVPEPMSLLLLGLGLLGLGAVRRKN